MAGKQNPAALLLPWQLRKGFELWVLEPTQKSGRPKTKSYGTVTDIGVTEKGVVANKRDQCLLKVHTSQQDTREAPLALQMALLDYKALHSDLLNAVNSNMPHKPTTMQLARKQPASVSFCPATCCLLLL
jgi:hypothetical protein